MKRLEGHLRPEERPPPEWQLVIRGSPNTRAKLAQSAQRMADQWSYAGRPCFGVTVHVVAPADLDRLLQTPAYRTRHSYSHVSVPEVDELEFRLLPTFDGPDHYTLLIEPYTDHRIGQLAALLQRRTAPNPHWLGRTHR